MKKRGGSERNITIVLLVALIVLTSFLILFNLYSPISVFTGKVIDEFRIEGTSTTSVSVDFNQEIGIVRDDFYGANTHGSWLGSGTRIDADGDGVVETASDLEWHRQMWLDSGMKLMRWDANLQNYYAEGWGNTGFEEWSNSSKGSFYSDGESGAVGWKISSFNGGTGFVSRSNYFHNGNYSMNVFGNTGSHVFVYRDINVKNGAIYNFSLWVKAEGVFNLKIQKLSDYSLCSNLGFVGNGSEWIFYSVTCNTGEFASNETVLRLVIDSIGPEESLLIDEATLLEDGIPFNSDYTFSGDLTKIFDQLEFAKANNLTVLIILSYTPLWLSDKSFNCIDSTKCPPYDFNLYGKIVNDYITRIANNGKYSEQLKLEVWNEPEIQFWLDSYPDDDIIKFVEYEKLFLSIKNNNPSFGSQIGGPSIASISNSNFYYKYLQNLAKDTSFFSLHKYSDNLGTSLYNEIKKVSKNCTFYQINCDHIVVSEYNTDSYYLKNNILNSSINTINLASGLASVLNFYPNIASLILFQWSETKKYSQTTNYPQYPQKWAMVSEPQLDNEVMPSYNVTKNFAHYHSGGSMVVNSSSDNAYVKSVASTKDGITHITVINSGNSTSVSLNLVGGDVTALQDIETEEVYSVSGGVVQLGTMSQYQIKYLVSYTGEIPSPANGTCGANNNECSTGLLSDTTDNSTHYLWQCTGTNGGTTASCSLTKPAVNGVCGSTTNNCTAGTLQDIADSSTNYLWNCLGINGGTNASCNKVITVSTSSSGGGGGGGGATTQIASNVMTNDTENNESKEDMVVYFDMGNDTENENTSDKTTKKNLSGEKSRLTGNVITESLGNLGEKIKSAMQQENARIYFVIFLTILIIIIIILIYLIKRRSIIGNQMQALYEWVQKARNMGHTDEHMEKALIEHGWQDNVVKKALGN
jgi:hypothetical protein